MGHLGTHLPTHTAHLRTHSWASCLGCPSTETRGTMWSGSSAGHTPEMTPPHVLSSYARTEGRRTPWSLGRRAGTGSGMDGRRAQSVQSATKIDQRHSHHLAPRRPPFGERCETWGKGMGQLTPSGITLLRQPLGSGGGHQPRRHSHNHRYCCRTTLHRTVSSTVRWFWVTPSPPLFVNTADLNSPSTQLARMYV